MSLSTNSEGTASPLDGKFTRASTSRSLNLDGQFNDRQLPDGRAAADLPAAQLKSPALSTKTQTTHNPGEAAPTARQGGQMSLSLIASAEAEATDFAALMEEPPGGDNFGSAATSDPAEPRALSVADAQTRELMQSGGWSVVHEKNGREAGLSAHRGIVHNEEHVDRDALLDAVERELGFTIDDVRSVYRQGRLTTEQAELRAAIDARLLGLSRSGASMIVLARIFGWAIEAADELGGDRCKTMERAVARARQIEAV